MFLDIQKLKTVYNNSRLDKTAIKMWCQILQKKGCIWHQIPLNKKELKSTKNMKLSTFFVGIRGQN